MMEKDPEKRPQNPAQLREAINQCLAGQIPGDKANVKTTTIAKSVGGKLSSPDMPDSVQNVLDSVFAFIPRESRMWAAIALLAGACVVVVALIVMLLLRR